MKAERTAMLLRGTAQDAARSRSPESGIRSPNLRSRNSALVSLFALFALLVLAGCPKPAAPVAPWGSSQAVLGVALACSTRAADPNQGEISYQIDWGDNHQSQWSPTMDASLAWGDTHTYASVGQYEVKARLRTRAASAWSGSLPVTVVAEGVVIWSFGFPDPESPEDSFDFTSSTCAITPGGVLVLSTEYGLVFRPRTGSAYAFIPEDPTFVTTPACTDSGYVFAACADDSLYSVREIGTRRWTYPDVAGSAAALGADGSVYFQTDDSVVGCNPDGTRRWATYSAGGSAPPVIATDGTVLAVNEDAFIFAFDPLTGLAKWTQSYSGSTASAPPAIDATRNVCYFSFEEGLLVALDLGQDGDEVWRSNVGADPSAPVIGTDGTVYLTAAGKLLALDPSAGGTNWTYAPPDIGLLSAPAASGTGTLYFLVNTGGKLKLPVAPDTLYAVNADGSRRWACGLGFGLVEDFVSAPKIDDNGLVYVGSDVRFWCVGGNGGPGTALWPMTGRDARNSGRAR